MQGPADHPFVGREAELARSRALLDTIGPAGRALLIEGDAGIGKTTLAEAVARLAAGRGFGMLRAGGTQTETASGFAGLHELLYPVLDRRDTLPARQRRALDVALSLTGGQTPSPLLIGLAALGLVEEYAADQPLLILVEDAQWLDPSTARVIAFLARRLSQAPVLLLITLRTEAAESSAASVIRALPIDRITLGPLSEAEADQLLRAQPQPPGRDRPLLLREAAGNPLAVVELARALRAEGSRPAGTRWLPVTKRLEQAFLTGVTRLPEPSRRMLLLLAAAPGQSPQQLMAAAAGAGLGPDDLEPVERSGLVSVTADRIVARHPLVMSAVYGAASFAERTAAHRLLAAAANDPDRAAWHRAAAGTGPDEDVAQALEATATRARARNALTEAVAALHRAADLSGSAGERTRRLAAGAEIARQAGDIADCTALLRAATGLATDPDVLAAVALTDVALSRSAMLPGPSVEDLLALAQRLGGPDGTANPVPRLRVLATAATANLAYGLAPALSDRLRAAIDATAGADGGILALVGRTLAAPDAFAGAALAQLPAILQTIRDSYVADDAGRWPTRPQIIIGVGLMASMTHDTAATADCWNLGVEFFQRTGTAGDESWALLERGSIRITAGHLADGLADVELAGRMATDLDIRLIAADADITAARAYAWRGDNDRARASLDAAHRLMGTQDRPSLRARFHWSAGLVALNEHRYDDAWTHLSAAQAHPVTALWSVGDLTEAAVRTGRGDQLTRTLTRAGARAAALGSSHLDALVRRSAALTDTDLTAEKHFEAALLADPGPLERARTQLGYGEWLRRQRRIVDARDQLSAALRAFDAGGATVWAERAAAELRAAGAAPARPAPSPGATAATVLTPQELMIAELAAAGLTNREIADRVMVSHRTIGSHLYNIFPKLGVSNRTQLRGALGPPGASRS